MSIAQLFERRLLRLRYLLWQRRRHERLAFEQIGDLKLIVLPQVMNPRIFRSGEYFASVLAQVDIAPHERLLDMGAGSGIMALTGARCALRVIAVDINPAAVRCTRINALLNNLEERVEVRQSNLFSNLQNETFDLVLFNPPFFRGQAQPGFDQAWRSEDAVERFAAQLRTHLTPIGSALILLSSDGESAAFLRVFAKHGYDTTTIASRRFVAETFTVYRISPRCKE